MKLSSFQPSYGPSPTPSFFTSHKPVVSHSTPKPSYVKKPKPNKQLYYTSPKPAYHSTLKPTPKTPRSSNPEVPVAHKFMFIIRGVPSACRPGLG